MNETLVPMDAKTVGDICDRFVNLVMKENYDSMQEKIKHLRQQIATMGKIKKFLVFGFKIPSTDGELTSHIFSINNDYFSCDHFFQRLREDSKMLASKLALACRCLKGETIYLSLSDCHSVDMFKTELGMQRTVLSIDVGNMPRKQVEEQIMDFKKKLDLKGVIK
jgi:hypothetical protein